MSDELYAAVERVRLEPCPFCGVPLTVRPSVNEVGLCDTPGCWMNQRMIGVVLDDPNQVQGWNRRAHLSPPEPNSAGHTYTYDAEGRASSVDGVPCYAPLPPAPIPVGDRNLDRELLAVQIAKVENWAGEMKRSARAMREIRLDDAARGNQELSEDLHAAAISLMAYSALISKVAELEGELEKAWNEANIRREIADAVHLRAEAAETALNTDRARIVEFFAKIDLGTGDDPVGFLLASHALMAHERNTAKEENGRLREAAKVALAYFETENERYQARQGVNDQNLLRIASYIRAALSADGLGK